MPTVVLYKTSIVTMGKALKPALGVGSGPRWSVVTQLKMKIFLVHSLISIDGDLVAMMIQYWD